MMAQGLKYKIISSLNYPTVATSLRTDGLSALSPQPAGTVPTDFVAKRH